MNFEYMTMTLGVVVDNNDPTCSCKVRVAAPGEFDTASIDKEVIPWAEPLFMFGYQSFSTLVEGSKVWLIKNKDNLNEYFYMPCSDPTSQSYNYLRNTDFFNSDIDIIFSKMSNQYDTIILNVIDDGLYIRANNYNNINVEICLSYKPEVIIKIHRTNDDDQEKITSFKIAQDVIYIGDELGNYEQLIKGNKLVEILQDLKNSFSSLSMACTTATYTTGIVDAVNKCAQSLDPINDILSENVKVS